jgi:catechol 2,3-dioxygenase-like lactoylglutathione lyase family enzyme
MARGLDHLVLAVRDLDDIADRYRRMGFTVGRRNRHPWGTLNHIVQMPGTFLELIATEPGFAAPAPDAPVAPFAGFIDHYLKSGDGFAMLVLESRDAAADLARLAAAGIAAPATFRFGRTGRRPDGSAVDVAFTLAFARLPAITKAGFFLCQQHNPENFWNREFQVHDNGVQSVAAVTFVSGHVARDAATIAAFAGAPAMSRADGAHVIDTGRGAIEVVPRALAAALYGAAALPPDVDGPHFAAVRFSVRALDETAAVLEAGAVPFIRTKGLVVVPAASAFGVTLAFEGP